MTQEFVTLPREVVEQVRGALAYVGVGNASENPNLAQSTCRQAIWKFDHALRAALEQPQAEQPAMTPIAQRKLASLLASGYTISGYSIYNEQKHQHGFVTGAGLVGWWRPEGMEYPQPIGEQEPVAWISPRALEWRTRQSEKVVKLTCKAQPEYDFTEPLYTRPQPKREPLPDHYINGMFSAASLAEGDMFRRFARAIEAAHDIK